MSKIVRMISIYNYGSRGGNSIKYIVIHYTGNKGDTAKNNGTYFCGGDRNASAATNLLSKGKDIKLVSKYVCQHNDISTTQKFYDLRPDEGMDNLFD